MDDDDQAGFAFDPRVIDWATYVQRRPPAVGRRSTPGCARRAAGAPSANREDRLRGQVLSPQRQLAAFDLENTLIASNVVASYSWLATRRLPPNDRLRFVAKTLAEAPGLLALDRRDRGDFLRHFYRRYEDAPIDQIADRLARAARATSSSPRRSPQAIRRVREHRALGHRTVLITGALDFIVEPIRPLFDDVVCASLSVRPDGTYSGELTEVPPTGEARAQVLFDYADAEGIDLARVGGLCRLVVRPPAARGGRLPGGGQPRDPAGRHRPQARAGWSSSGPRRPAAPLKPLPLAPPRRQEPGARR